VNAASRLLLGCTIAAGTITCGVAAALFPWHRLVAVALLTGAALIAELVQISGEQDAPDPVEASTFSFSSCVHVAAVLLVGGLTAALIASAAVLVVDGLRRDRFVRVAYNASVFAVSAAVAGVAYGLLGGRADAIELHRDGFAIVAAVLVYAATNTLLVSGIVATTRRTPFLSVTVEGLRTELPTMAAELALGIAIALFATTNPLALTILVPLASSVYLSHARLTATRRETARALETFANVVDERDSSTFAHSERVANYVQELAEALGFSASTVARFRWAGRLHDLGKIGVDTSVLRKPGKLDHQELVAIRRHARVSARLLRTFRFAADEARAVEYHHERFDGAGYYGIAEDKIPLASHFLIVADSFDAMTNDRPYRDGLPREEALSEIERHLGSQFHPLVGRAFVALQRGIDPTEALTPDELRELRSLAIRRRRPTAADWRHVPQRAELLVLPGIVLALLLALVQPLAAIPGVVLSIGSAVGIVVRERRSLRLARDVADVAARAERPEAVLPALGARLLADDVRWLLVFEWRRDLLSGSPVAEWGTDESSPSTAALTSWLVREADAEGTVLVCDGAELGTTGSVIAAATSADTFLVFGCARLRPHVSAAAGEIAQALADYLPQGRTPTPALAAVS